MTKKKPTITELRLQLRQAGYQPIPVRGKNPGMEENWQWQLLGDADADAIKQWAQQFPDATNTGILTKFAPTLDSDIEHPLAGYAIQNLVRDMFGDLALIRVGWAPRFCAPFRTDAPFRKITRTLINPTSRRAEKLEFLGDGQQVVAFGLHPGIRMLYRWRDDRGPAKIPRVALPEINADSARALLDACAQLVIRDFGYQEPPEPELKIDDMPRPAHNGHGDGGAYARAALAREAATLAQVQPGGRNDALNVAALKCFGFVPDYLTAGEVSDVLTKACQTNGLIKDDGLRSVQRTLKSAYDHARTREPPLRETLNHAGSQQAKTSESKKPKESETTETKSERPRDNKQKEEEPDFGAEERLLVELNRDNCVVPNGGKTWVLRFEPAERSIRDDLCRYDEPTFFRFGDFRNLYLNRLVNVGDKWIDIGRWWLKHRNRRQYAGIVFLPAGPSVTDRRLNLWRGWGVEPKQGDWSLLREHIHDVLAAGDDDIDRYIINWLAWAVQHPDQQAETALVLIGERGSGKGTLGNAMCRIFGQHAQHISSPEHLTGRFNHHLRACSFLFADEAYGPKDKSAEGALKRLITEDTLTIEQKGHDVVEQPNYLHVMLASNGEWVVPAGAFERRFVVLRVAETHRQDREWFAPLYEQMKAGGYAAMLYDLSHRDLTNWHPRDIVRTAELARQQEESLNPLDEWWFELLQTGVLSGAHSDDPSAAVSNRYEDKVHEIDEYGNKRTRFVWRDGLYDQARRVSPRLKGMSDHKLGSYLNDQGCTNARPSRRRGWQFPQLIDCRKRWLERFPDTVWHDPNIQEWIWEEDE